MSTYTVTLDPAVYDAAIAIAKGSYQRDILDGRHSEAVTIEVQRKATSELCHAERARLPDDEVDLPAGGRIDHVEQGLVGERIARGLPRDIHVRAGERVDEAV